MSISSPATSTDSSGQPIQGTSGTSIGNSSVSQLGTSQFLDLMMTQLKYQDPANPTDPQQYLGELAQMSAVEQETNIAQSTGQSASAQAVSSAVSLIGDSVTYIDQKTGQQVTGPVQSVQITSSGPTLTIGGVAGIAPSTVTAVMAAGSAPASATSPGTGSAASSGTNPSSAAGAGS